VSTADLGLGEHLRGIIIRDDPDALVVRPSAGEVQRFGAGTPVQVARPPQPAIAPREGLLYDWQGRAIAVVRSVNMRRDVMEMTSVHDNYRQFAPHGPVRIDMTVDVIASADTVRELMVRSLQGTSSAAAGPAFEPTTSPVLCAHANEVPRVCQCGPDCYCRREGSCRR